MNDVTVIQDNPLTESMESMLKFSETVAKSGLCPAGLATKEQVFVAVEWGKELGLSPMVAVNNVAVVNGRPSLSTDVMHAIASNSPSYRGVQWLKQDEQEAECIITRFRNNTEEKTRGYYSIKDAERADLLKKDNWKKYPARMLQKRALSYALRDAFSDLLSGVYSPDELENTDEPVRTINPVERADDFDTPAEQLKSAKVEDFE